MPKQKYTPIYGKWDSAESPEVAFENVKSGIWDKARFLEWHEHYLMTKIRDEMADASI